ncbi:MAG: MFS transporter [Acidobacteriaceae bacterium]|nr:MFS transporter [Acidobacteriaceae bacterium]
MPSDQQRSLRALDWINFFMADVNTGIGPFLAIYLTASRHWNPASVGVVISAQSIASVAVQGPAGWLVDWSQHKKQLIIYGAAAVALGCIGIVHSPNEPAEILTQILIGIAAAIFPPAIAAISLGIVGKGRLSGRVGRNETFNHAGNVVFALLAGAVGTWLGQQWIFYVSAIVAAGTVAAAASIRSEDINNETARAATQEALTEGQGKQRATVASFRDLLHNRRLWIFTASVVLFHFANAAMLPLVGELLSKGRDGKSSFYMSACIVAAQFVMIPIAFLTGKFADSWGRKPLFLIGFGVLTLRGVLYTLGKNSIYLLSVQALDGVGAAIFGVLWVIIISDLAKGTGRFNLLQGVIQAALGLGAFLSNFVAGFIVKAFGYNTGFLGLAAVALAGLLFFALFMPETKEYKGQLTSRRKREPVLT